MHTTLYFLPALLLSFSLAAPLAKRMFSSRVFCSAVFRSHSLTKLRAHTDIFAAVVDKRDTYIDVRSANTALSANVRAVAKRTPVAPVQDADDSVSNTWDRRSITPQADADDTVSNSWDKRSIAPQVDADDSVSNTWDRRAVVPRADADDTVSNTWD